MMASPAINDVTGGTHFVFIVDLLLKPNFDFASLTQCLDAIVAFGTSLLMQLGSNKLTILGSSPIRNMVLYSDDDKHSSSSSKKMYQNGQQMEKFALITSVVKSNFTRWVNECNDQAAGTQPTSPNMVSLLSGALSQALCLVNRFKADFNHSRVIIFSLGATNGQNDCYTSQYMRLINCFFGAQKINLLLDACSAPIMGAGLTEDSAPVVSASMEDRFAASILQQGCDLTGGRYIRVHKLSTLLQHLFWCFTPSAAERPTLVLPPKLRITPPAACFCHRKVLDVGYVCSVCISIFCQYLPFCTTCNSNVFLSSLKRIARLKASSAAIKSE